MCQSWRQWLASIRKSQNDLGALPGIVPTAGWGFEWGNGPAWDCVLFNLPYELYKKRGCTEVIKENAHAMVRYLEYILTKRSDNGTVAIGLGDWVPVGTVCDAYSSPLALTDSIMVMDMAKKASEMFGETALLEQFIPPDKSSECASRNHHFFGDIANWYMSAVAGLRVIDSGHIEIRPNFIKQLEYASAFYDLPDGRVSVLWKRNGEGIELDVSCPTEYEIIIPQKYSSLNITVKK